MPFLPNKRANDLSIDDSEGSKWMNQHFYVRQGVGFDEMNTGQHGAAAAS